MIQHYQPKHKITNQFLDMSVLHLPGIAPYDELCERMAVRVTRSHAFFIFAS